MSADYSFYALLCGFMPRPEGVRREEREFFSFFLFYVILAGTMPYVVKAVEVMHASLQPLLSLLHYLW